MSALIDKIFPPMFVSTETDDQGKEWGVRELPDGSTKRVLLNDPNFVHAKADPKLAQKHESSARDARKAAQNLPEGRAKNKAKGEAQRQEDLARYARSDRNFGLAMSGVGVLGVVGVIACVVALVFA